MKILALDLGKFKTVACVWVDGDARSETMHTLNRPASPGFSAKVIRGNERVSRTSGQQAQRCRLDRRPRPALRLRRSV